MYWTFALNQLFSMKKRLNHLRKTPVKVRMKRHLHLDPKSSRMKILSFLPLLTHTLDNLCHAQKP